MKRDFTLGEAHVLAGKLREEFPDAIVKDCDDFGFTVTIVHKGHFVIACRPAIGDGMPPFMQDIEEIRNALLGTQV